MRDLPALALDELQSESAQLLPRRETLCQFGCVNVTNVVGVNLAIAVNAASIGADASAVAQQYLGATHN
jgi:hypothetical protein